MSKFQNVLVGIAGWEYPDWTGIVYPAGKIDKLAYIAGYVEVIELNTTFYRPAMPADSKSWIQRTRNNPNLKFTAKLHKSFTHDGVIDTSIATDFITGLEPMLAAGKLQHLLMQFSFAFDASDEHKIHLQKLARIFGADFRLIVEVRNRSWQTPDNLKFLSGLGLSLCNPDCALARDSFFLPDCSIGSVGYMRLHGRNADTWFDSEATRDEKYDYYYSPSELHEILARLELLADQFETYFVIANNHYKGAQMANALELKSLLTGLKQPIPENLLTKYPHLNEIAKNPGLF